LNNQIIYFQASLKKKTDKVPADFEINMDVKTYTREEVGDMELKQIMTEVLLNMCKFLVQIITLKKK